MTIEALLDEIRMRKLFVSNLYEGSDRKWRCFLRAKRNDLAAVHRGMGDTMIAAITEALPPLASEIEIEDLLGD